VLKGSLKKGGLSDKTSKYLPFLTYLVYYKTDQGSQYSPYQKIDQNFNNKRGPGNYWNTEFLIQSRGVGRIHHRIPDRKQYTEYTTG